MKDQPFLKRDSGPIIALTWLFVIAVMVTFIAVARAQSPEIQCSVNAADLFLLECQEGDRQFKVAVKREFKFHPDLTVFLYKDRRGRLRLDRTEEQERGAFKKNWQHKAKDGRLIRR